MKLIRRLAAACLALMPWNASRHADAAEPLVLAKTGYLFAGGKIDTSLPGSPMISQLYAEFQIPQKLLHPYPIVMIHGGSQTGTNFTGASTVDFGGTATTYSVVSPTSITATSPGGPAGTVDVTVTTSTGTSAISQPADQFTYEDVPTVSTVSPAAGLPAGGASVVVSGANFTDANAVSFGTLAAASFTVGSASQISAVSPVATGFGTLDVTVTTPSGTSAIAQPADQFTYEQLPSVTTISPLAGPLGGGTALTITGTGFTAATAVSFGTAAAESFTVASSTQIGATSALVTAAATVDVTVSTPNGTSARSAVDQFAYEATPSVTALSPMAGLAGGGSAVTITGTGFSAASAVMFGTTNAASSYSVASSSEITAISPAGTAGTVDVTVTTPVGTSAISPPADQYTYEDVPTVDLVSPVAGPTLGSTLVSISGTDFTDATSVQFGAAAAGGFTVVSPTSMTATSPGTSPGGTAGTVDITVTTPIGTSATTAADQFAYEAVPSVTSVSPLAGLASGGSSVTITGTNFTGASAVSFGATPAGSYAVNSATSAIPSSLT